MCVCVCLCVCVCVCVHDKRMAVVQHTATNLRLRCALALKDISLEGLPRVQVTNKGTWNPGRRLIKSQVRCCSVAVLVVNGDVKRPRLLSDSFEVFSCCISLYGALPYNNIP